MKWPKLRELKEAVTSVIHGPYTHRFPAEATPTPDWIRGKPEYHEAECIGCGACAEVCPVRAIDVKDVQGDDGKSYRHLILHFDNCVFCGECVRNCTTQKGVTFSDDYELSGFDRTEMVETVQKELVACELCGEAIAPKDHLLWLYRRLGSLAFSNMTAYLTAQEEMGLRESMPRDERPIDRTDIQRQLCPACRRSVTLLDEWGPVT